MDVRTIGVDDLDLICQHREAMFREAGFAPGTLRTMTDHFRAWLRPRLADGSYFGFLLTDAGRPVAGIGLMLVDWPPHPAHPTQDRRGYVLNVYVEPTRRRRGLAQQLMALAEAEFARRGVEFAVLHATEAGRPLYQRSGWNQTSEMSKVIAPPAP
ncbi:MAG: GNAT family N-acetyltransferase [Pseudomonadota bacterium]|mgnify:FL=1